MASKAPVTSTGYSAVFVTVPTDKIAKQIAHGLVTEMLAAHVNIIPKVTSVYMWKGELNEDIEFLLMIKTRASKIPELTEYVNKNHPHEICEVIALPITAGNKPYFVWIDEVVPEK